MPVALWRPSLTTANEPLCAAYSSVRWHQKNGIREAQQTVTTSVTLLCQQRALELSCRCVRRRKVRLQERLSAISACDEQPAARHPIINCPAAALCRGTLGAILCPRAKRIHLCSRCSCRDSTIAGFHSSHLLANSFADLIRFVDALRQDTHLVWSAGASAFKLCCLRPAALPDAQQPPETRTCHQTASCQNAHVTCAGLSMGACPVPPHCAPVAPPRLPQISHSDGTRGHTEDTSGTVLVVHW